MVTAVKSLAEQEAETLKQMDRDGVEFEETAAVSLGIDDDVNAIIADEGGKLPDSRITRVINCLPVNKNGVLHPLFWRYWRDEAYKPIFWEMDDPFNDLVIIINGPRGGGKTLSAVMIQILDGQMRGIPCISNVPFSWVAKDSNNKLYKVESLPFDQEAFARGDPKLKYKRLLIDEGNYLADRLRSTSNKNLAMTDILQQARKLRMTVIFATINWMWLDPRITGSLCDIIIKSEDMYYKPYGKRHGMRKGWRLAWEMQDQSGKTSGQQFKNLPGCTVNARVFWHTYDTENFVDPRQARKRLKAEEKIITDEFGNEVTLSSWLKQLEGNLFQLSKSQTVWDGTDLWDSLGISQHALRVRAGVYMRNKMGVDKEKGWDGKYQYDLSILAE